VITAGRLGQRQSERFPGKRVLYLSADRDSRTQSVLTGYGCIVDGEVALQSAIFAMTHDPVGYDLFVMDCDGLGGVDAGVRTVARLIKEGARMRIVLISREFDEAAFPLGKRAVVSLPKPVDDAQLRMGFDHALRDFHTWTVN
jgi:hypothetical protein